MIMLANTILVGHWPYYITIYLWPLVVLVEMLVLWRRHRTVFRWWKALWVVLFANVASFLVGAAANQGGFRGLESAPHFVIDVTAMLWAWAMSTGVEYFVLRFWLKDISWQQCANTSAIMNLASYGLIIAPALIWIATR